MPRLPSQGGSLSASRTPNAIRTPPICTDPLSAITTGLICSIDDARKYLDKNGWVLLGEPYSRSKLAHIIATVALGDTLTLRTASDTLKLDIKNTLLSVSFLINSDITDHISDTLTEAITAKTEASLIKLENTTSKLAESANFATANDISRAATSVTLDKIAQKLNQVTNTLTTLSNVNPHAANHPHFPMGRSNSWADVARVNPLALSSRFYNPASNTSHTRLQQCIICDSRIIRITYLKSDDTVPKDHSPSSLAALRKTINRSLFTIDSQNISALPSHPPQQPPKTFVRGVTATDKGAFILELDTVESAQRFISYANDLALSIPSNILGLSATIGNRPHCVIAKFVPCDGAFDPSDNNHLRQIEYDNSLPVLGSDS
ncbi:hypothetical protein C0991_005649 [Blastosporella zonata]|nr:hypothetical protein C0991_005649 [Blastosporella zonata]